MTLTVRLDDTLASALARHCHLRGVTKSAVVQEALVQHLVKMQAAPAPASATGGKDSAHHLAFLEAGLLGAVAIETTAPEGSFARAGADKAEVRARIAARLAGSAPGNTGLALPPAHLPDRPLTTRSHKSST
jgi:predicted transcriptional regulator